MNNEISYQRDFISKEKELEILKVIPKDFVENKDPLIYKLYRFGNYVHPYNTHLVSEKIPDIFYSLNIELDFDSITINEFQKDQNINYHIDSKYCGDKIYVLSLCGSSELSFRDGKNNKKNFLIEPRSLYIIEGDLRSNWQHSVIAFEHRISIVFRKSINK